MIVPTINYHLVLWGGILNTHLEPIQIKMNKILRVILGVKFNENRVPLMPTNQMYTTLNLLKLDDLYRFSLLKFIHFILYNEQLTFTKYFGPLLPTHAYNTRNIKINLPSVRLRVERNFAVFNICNLINEVPDSFLEPQSKNSLKRRFMKKHLLLINLFSQGKF